MKIQLFALVFVVLGLSVPTTAFAKKCVTINKKGTHDGPYLWCWRNGKIREKGAFKNGKLDGPFVSYKKNGEKNSSGTMVAGKAQGTWYFGESKRKKKAFVSFKEFTNGVPNGREVGYHHLYKKPRISPVAYRGQWKDGKRIGKWGWFAPNKRLVKMAVYEEGKPPLRTTFHSKKTKSSEGRCLKIPRCMTTKHGTKVGEWTTWHKNGKKESVGTYKPANKKDGEWRRWARDGQLVKIENYRGGVLHGKQKYVGLDGSARISRTTTSNYQAGKRHGLDQWANPSGEVRSKTYWKNGVKSKEAQYFTSAACKRSSAWAWSDMSLQDDKKGTVCDPRTKRRPFKIGQKETEVEFRNGKPVRECRFNSLKKFEAWECFKRR